VATRARFGRLPRSAPSLTATIVALGQQYEAQRERNLFDSWNQGGDWEGKKATDEVLMKYLKEKLSGLDRNDPKANEVRIQIASYEFAIENSKMEVKYAQKKVSDSGMAAFYRKWADKLPTDSEAYRQRAKLAAQYADRAHSAASSGRRAASDNAYYNRQTAIGNEKIRPYADLFATIEDYARKGIIGYIAPALNTTGEGIADLRVNEGDATTMLAMLDQLAKDPALADWRKEYIDRVRKYGGQISGDTAFTQQGILAMADQAIAGYNAQIEVAKKAGRKGDVTALRNERDKVKDSKATISTIDEKADYEDSRKDWLEIVQDPDSTVAEKMQATNRYKNKLLDLAKRADRAGDSVAAGRYNTEFLAANGGRDLNGNDVDVTTGPTMWESSRPTSAEHPGKDRDAQGNPVGDAYSTALSVREYEDYQRLLDYRDETGAKAFAQVRVDDKGNLTSDPKFGFTVRAVAGLGDVVYTTTDGDARNGKGGVLTALVPSPIKLQPETKADQNGIAAPIKVGGNSDEITLGGTVRMADGTILYAYQDDSGTTKYTENNPFTGAVTSDGKGNLILKVTLDEKGKAAAEKNGVNRGLYVLPDYRSSELNKNQPNTVFNSPQAWEMAKDPTNTYSKYTPDDIDSIARAQSKGDATKYATIKGELDNQRAEYIRKGGLNYDQTLRLASARLNGNLPLLSDYVGGVTINGMNVRGTRIDTAEGRALAEKFGGDSKAAANLIADTVQKQWGYTTPNLEQARKTGVIEMYGPPAPTTTKTMAQQSKALADGLIKDIWWNVTKPVGGTQPGTPGRPNLGPTPSPAPPKPSAPPPPKPTPPPPAPKPKPAPAPAPAPKPSTAPVINPYTGFNTSGPAAGPNAAPYRPPYSGWRAQ
jgi:cell division septation protein DedD